jgi:ABC-2 type transport system ATP-binding protein
MTVLVSTHYMDEAERCHELVYIAYGTVLARGQAPAVIEQAGLPPDATLEEAFIRLIDRARDNFAAQ